MSDVIDSYFGTAILRKATILSDPNIFIDSITPIDPDMIVLDSSSYVDGDLALEAVFIPLRVEYRNSKSIRKDIPRYKNMSDTELFPYVLIADSSGNTKFLTLQKDTDIFDYEFRDENKTLPEEPITKKFGIENHPYIHKKFYIPKQLYNRSYTKTTADVSTLERFYEPSPPPKKLFYNFRAEYVDYIDIENWVHTTLTLWTLGTYFYQIFGAYPYTLMHKLKGSGKTRTLRTIEALARDAILLDNTTLSPLFRLADTFHPTLLLDQCEKLGDMDQKEFSSALCSGYTRGATVYRSERSKDKNFVPRGYDIYCPKALASIDSIDNALEDRCIHIPIKRTMKVKDFSLDPNIVELKYLRNDARIFTLFEGPKIYQKYNRGKYKFFKDRLPKDNPRLTQLLTPILVMAEVFQLDKDEAECENIYKIIDYETDIHKSESVDELDNAAIAACSRLLGDNDTVWVTNKDLVGSMDPISEKQRHYYERAIGKRMKGWGFKKRMVNGRTRYHIRCDNLSDLMLRYNIEVEGDDNGAEEQRQL